MAARRAPRAALSVAPAMAWRESLVTADAIVHHGNHMHAYAKDSHDWNYQDWNRGYENQAQRGLK